MFGVFPDCANAQSSASNNSVKMAFVLHYLTIYIVFNSCTKSEFDLMRMKGKKQTLLSNIKIR